MGLEKNFKIVSQDSELGALGLRALFDKGFCGPNFDLSGENVWVEVKDNEYAVSFYDMSCTVRKEDKNYESFKGYFESRNP